MQQHCGQNHEFTSYFLRCFHRDSSALLSDLWVFDLDDNTWVQPATFGQVPPPRVGASMYAKGATVYLSGGSCFDGSNWVQCSGVYSVDVTTTGGLVWRR
jgi:hypothetical protein